MEAPPFPADVLAAACAAAKAHLRIVGDSEDAVIRGYAAAALALCEAFTARALIVRDFVATVPADARWQALPVAPVTAIGAVSALHADGEAFALAVEGYAVDVDAAGTGWVRVTAPGVRRVLVDFTAGMAAEWEALPAPLAQGAVLLVAHLFAGRDGDDAPPAAVSALWRPWRRLRLRAERAA